MEVTPIELTMNPTAPTDNVDGKSKFSNRKGSGSKNRQNSKFANQKNEELQRELQATLLNRLKITDPTNLNEVQLQSSIHPARIPITLRGMPPFVKELWLRMKSFSSLATDVNYAIFLKCLMYIAESRVFYAQLTCGRAPPFELTSLTAFTEMQLRAIKAYSSRLPFPMVIFMEAIGNTAVRKQFVIPCEMITTPPAANGAISFFPTSIESLLTSCSTDQQADSVLMSVAQHLLELPNIVWIQSEQVCPVVPATTNTPAQPERRLPVAHVDPQSRSFWRFPMNREWLVFSQIIASMESKKDFLLHFDVTTGLGSSCQIVRFPDDFDSEETETLYYMNDETSEFDEKLAGALLMGLERGSLLSGRFTSSYDGSWKHGSVRQAEVRHAVVWANH